MTNLNYYWQKRNEQEQKTRDREKLNSDIEAGLAHKANQERIKKLEDEVAAKSRKPVENNESSAEVEAYYRSLLSKPMLEIAVANGKFKETYEKQQELLGNWIVSQKAYKEIAIQLGIQAGKTKEEIIAEGLAMKEKVLDGQTEYGNNFIDDEKNDWAIYYAPKIKERFLK